ncbi:SDR family NAD(P)-dependent oxidoreductase [Acinetobacter puyangensis]|uniref:NAD(P)-dependent dehydrogenase, short-chain alcohol dehydrogenase family n=1 Tax=Acinetobacter puyangensis TaxID=1096779 RepID=A0A240EAV2_9GAMM|nr:SDR family oxidoreductase [Acinetobacter puyangensis]SNX45802.1 NAD(P)-dependent dehydrogenase, short-chain alcohol dehydrogenase family [Acinetobacter puyangensis]
MEIKTAVITGGGTGIGLATALLLLEQGWRVLALGLQCEQVISDQFHFYEVDICDLDQVKKIFDHQDKVDALIHCAGMIKQKQEWEIPTFEKVMEVNLNTAFAITTLLQDKLIQAKGSIIHIASMWSFFGSAQSPAYAASKAGVAALTRSLAVALGAKGVRVNAIAPGWIDTAMGATAKNDPERYQKIIDRIPLARWAQPTEIAQVIIFLLSAHASYIHGAVLPVDGGYSIA